MERFKKALKDVFVWDGRDCMYIKNEKERVRARCAEEKCPWLIYVARNSKTMAFEIKTFHNKHTYGRDYGSNLADRAWVTDKLEKRLATQPKLTPREATEHMKQDYNVQVHPKMIQMALKAAREIVVGNDKAQYGKLWDYLQELHRSNWCMKFAITLYACRNGFVKGCRPLIGLDGCFLKGYYGGQLLTAMSLDANNHVFVIAYAVTRAENTENWMWFLTRFQDDLGDHQVHGWNLMSDQQKLTEMPYVHAVAAISKLRIKVTEDFVSPYLTIDAVRKTYDLCVNPVNSKEFWEKTDHPKPQPPRIVRPAGRPKKHRTESGAPLPLQ
ncbi:uncharacterized protein LOC130974956 [Arachis stenosperma]|uniref:uncharacterized protein LOC130974956 n=1 Tax=Arachis stenosperma TaxID=217475 RepID=UPI0025ACC20B|nr:uncharacterized protein LOC130974956 [Arachis stenosperma]